MDTDTDEQEETFRLRFGPTNAILFAHTDCDPAEGWQRVSPGLLALTIPLPLMDHQVDGRGTE